MRSEFELDSADYHLRLMVEQMQRDGRSEHAIQSAVLIASGRKPPAERPQRTTTNRQAI
jgi:hypothetical protein